MSKVLLSPSLIDLALTSPIPSTSSNSSIEAFNTPKDVIQKTISIYKERRDVALSGLKELGWNIKEPIKGTFYLWLPIPPSFKTSGEFATAMLDKCGIVVPPGSGYGEYGEGYFRIALTIDKKRIQEGISRMKKEGLVFAPRACSVK